MKKLILLLTTALGFGTAFCAVTTHLSLDCREVVKIVNDRLPLVYDASWYENGVTAKITAGGQVIASGAAGEYGAWSPSFDGVELMTMNVYNSSGEIVGAENVWWLSRGDLTDLVIPEGTTEVGEYAFAGGQFTSVTIPNSVTNISPTAFAGCEKIVDVSLGIPQDALGAGFYEAEFTNMQSFDGSRPIVENARQVTPRAEMMFADNTSQYTMYAYAARMYFEGGVAYYFSAQYDDKSSIKIDDVTVINPGNDCQRYTGSIMFFSDGWHDLELRGWNGGGNGALNYGSAEGLLWWTSRDSTKRGFANYEGRVIFCVGGVGQLFPDSYAGVKVITLTGGTTIPDGFCIGCVSLETVTIPNSVTNIGEDAFAGCEKLSRVNIPSVDDWLKIDFANEEANPLHAGAKLYVGGEDASELMISEGTTEIGDFAFQGGQFTSVTIPNSVTNISPTAFAGCEKIVDVSLPIYGVAAGIGVKHSQWIVEGKTDGAVVYRSSNIGSSQSTSIEYLIPAGVLTVDFSWKVSSESGRDKLTWYLDDVQQNAISGEVDWSRVNKDLDGAVHTVRFTYSKDGSVNSGSDCGWVVVSKSSPLLSEIFSGSYGNIQAVALTNGTVIPYAFFSGCDALESVSIPMSVTNIDATAFAGCKNVKNLTFGFNEDGGNGRSAACILPDSYAGLERVTIVEGTAEIPSGAFAGCASLASVTIPAGVTNVGANAFSGCDAVSRVDVPSLEDWLAISFENADANPLHSGASLCAGGEEVTTVFIPQDMTNICVFAFVGCSSVSTFEVAATNLWHEGDEPLNLATLFPDSVAGITDVAVDEGVLVLPDDFVEGCTSLETLALPASLEDFGDNDIRWFGEKVGKDGLWIENGWVLGYIGTAPENVVIPEGVKGIAGYAFEGQMGIETVEFPESLRYIGVGSFKGCVNLEGLELPEGLERIDDGAFKNCTWIQDVEFPSTLTRIGKSAFENCTSIYPGIVFNEGLKTIEESAFSNCWRMVSVAMPASVDEVGDGAFYDCRNLIGATIPTHVRPVAELFPSAYANLKSIVIAEGETNMTDGIFAGCAALPQIRILDTIPEISASAFYGCAALEKVLFDGEILAVGDDAFVGCSALQLPLLPETVRSIGARAFKGLSQFSEFKFPASLVTIGAEAFSGCSGISAVELPRGLETLGEKAFYGVTKLTAANIPATVTSLGTAAFGGCGAIRSVSMPGGLLTASSVFPDSYRIISSATVTDGSPEICADLFNGCWQLAQVDLPTSVTNIGANAFLNCSALTAVGIPGGVRKLGTAAFKGCSSITSLSLPQGLTSIADETFYGCSSLGELVIPGSVTSLGARVFSGCNAMTSVSYVGNAPSYVDSSYSGASAAMVSRVVLGTTGWDGVAGSKAIPEVWPVTNSRAIQYWDVITFDVSFYGNGGAPELATVGQVTGLTYALPLEDPVRTGYAFAGWWTETENGAQVKATDKVAATRPHNLYAHWTPNEYTVAFHANGGLGTMESVTLQYDAAATLMTCGFYRKNAEFAGWATEKDGPVVYADGAEVKNLSAEANALVTLYAVWSERIWSAADYLGCPGRPFVDSGDAPWVPDEEMFCSAPGSMRSGAIEAAEEYGRTESVLSTTVLGEGSGSFWWKVDCEPEDGGEYYDYALFEIDGVEVAKIAGHVNWTEVRFEVTGAGEHTLRWTFTRDDWDEDPSLYENAAWLDDFVFVPTPVMVAFDGNGATAGEVPSVIVSSAGESVTLPDAGTLRNGAMLFEGWLDSDRGETYRGGDAYVVGVTNVTLKAVWSEHVWTLAEILGADNLTFTTDEGDAAWFGDFANTHDGKVALRSGAIGDSQESRVTAMFSGDGELAFWTRTDGEFNRGKMVDYLKVELDGELVFSGATNDWTNVIITVSGLGEHAVVWTYLKNGSKSVGLDRAWLSEVVWTPAAAEQTETRGTPVPVAFEWLETYYPDLATVEEHESTALATGANGLAVWESFVAGLDPTEATSKFTAKIEIGFDGKPVITWAPDLSDASGAGRRVYKTFGKASLDDATWTEVDDANRAGMRFFKVTVELP